MWTVCEFHGSNGNGFGDIWWTDNPIYFSSIDMRYICCSIDFKMFFLSHNQFSAIISSIAL